MRVRRPRSHSWLRVSVFFIAYSVFQAVFSAKLDTYDVTETVTENILDITNNKNTSCIPFEEEEWTSIEEEEASKKVMEHLGVVEKNYKYYWTAASTVHPLRSDCTPPAIEQFPLDLFGPAVRKHGGLIIHVLVAVFTFIGLAIVCNGYFVPSLGRICEELKLAPNVAGATIMAAGTTAPKLVIVITRLFIACDDIGVSGVIGSAVFNIMFVISVCALCAGTVSHLNWWPLCRDCVFYAISILAMLFIICNGYISWLEALSMLILYGVYCVALICCNYNKYEFYFVKSSSNTKGACNDPESTQTCNSNQACGEQQVPTAPAYYKAKEYNPETAVNPLVKPEGANNFQLFYWYIVFPNHWACRLTMPDCRGRWYPVTFIISMLWISFYSYFMVWMVTIIGYTLGIPDAVMGLTLVAASVSVPSALTSLAVIKEGYGDMAVSNAVGSNVFDILVCLGLPWFMQTAIILPGSYVNVISKGLVYSAQSLLSTVVFLVVATFANGLKLDRKYGAVLMAWYLLFVSFASMYELNVFGDFNPPDCLSAF